MRLQPKQKIPFKVFSAYCLRSPILPFQFIEQLTSSTETSDESLFKCLDIPIIKEAIYLASPELHQQLHKWVSGELKDSVKIQRLRSSSLKYITRMSTRCTPFGLFASCSAGTFQNQTSIEPNLWNKYKKVTRWDMHFLVLFATYLEGNEKIKNQLSYFPNSTLYRIGDRYRVHTLESVAHSEYLEALIEKAKEGVSISALIAILIKMDIDTEDAKDFIQELKTRTTE